MKSLLYELETLRYSNRKDKKTIALRRELYRMIKRYRKENPFQPKDYSVLKLEYGYQSKVSLIPGRLYKMVQDSYIERTRFSVYEEKDYSEENEGCFRYLKKKEGVDHPYIFKGLHDEYWLDEGDLFCIGIATEQDEKEFNNKVNIHRGITLRLEEINEERERLYKYLENVTEGYYKTFK